METAHARIIADGIDLCCHGVFWPVQSLPRIFTAVRGLPPIEKDTLLLTLLYHPSDPGSPVILLGNCGRGVEAVLATLSLIMICSEIAKRALAEELLCD